LALEHAAHAANDPVPSGKKKGTRKHASKKVLVSEPGSLVANDKMVKPNVPYGRCGNAVPRDVVPHF
jgi:hypothetical protein